MSTGPPAGPRSVKLCSDQKIFQFLFRTMPLLNPFSKKKAFCYGPYASITHIDDHFTQKNALKLNVKYESSI